VSILGVVNINHPKSGQIRNTRRGNYEIICAQH